MIKNIIIGIATAIPVIIVYKTYSVWNKSEIENDKKLNALNEKYEKKFHALGIMDGNVSFEKCRRAMDDANENKTEDEINEIVELSDHYIHGSLRKNLRKGNAILFHHDCSHCKTIAYITCMRIITGTNQSSNKRTKEMLANAILSNYRHIEPYIEKNEICREKFLTKDIRNEIVQYVIEK